MGLGERAGKEIVGELELAQDLVLALAQERRLGAFRVDLHLHVIRHADLLQCKTILRIRK